MSLKCHNDADDKRRQDWESERQANRAKIDMLTDLSQSLQDKYDSASMENKNLNLQISNLSEENGRLKSAQSSKDEEVSSMMSKQLQEMTEVLDEVDKKYSRKESQLRTAREQNQKLKQAFD